MGTNYPAPVWGERLDVAGRPLGFLKDTYPLAGLRHQGRKRGRSVGRWGSVLPAFLMGLLVAAAGAWCATPPSPVVDAGIRVAVRQGSARVIVELRIPGGVKPEGELTSPAAVAAQRRAISDAQASVVARLAGTRFSLLRQYRSAPFLALEVGPDALTALEGMGDVVSRVLEDRTVLPRAGTGTQPERPLGTP